MGLGMPKLRVSATVWEPPSLGQCLDVFGVEEEALLARDSASVLPRLLRVLGQRIPHARETEVLEVPHIGGGELACSKDAQGQRQP